MMRSRAAAVSAAALGALLLGAQVGACASDETGEGSTSTSRSTVTSMVTTSAPAAGSASTALPAAGSPELADVLRRAVEEERGAEATYRNVIVVLGAIRPFTNIADSEARHVASLEQLTTRYGVDVADMDPAGAPAPGTKSAACEVGVAAERADIALYDELLPRVTGYADVTQVLQNLRAASQDQHLPAFERCA